MSAAAKEAGFAKSLVSKWKAKKVKVPSPDILQKLSAYFNMPVSELLGEQKENPGTIAGTEVDEVTMQLMDVIQNGSDEDRRDLLDMYLMLKRREKR